VQIASIRVLNPKDQERRRSAAHTPWRYRSLNNIGGSQTPATANPAFLPVNVDLAGPKP
jgi:hypothetical protein